MKVPLAYGIAAPIILALFTLGCEYHEPLEPPEPSFGMEKMLVSEGMTFRYKYWKDGIIQITGYTGKTDATVPQTIDGMPVRVGTKAFYKMNLTSLTIPPGVVGIAYAAFKEYHLTEIEIPGGIKSIDDSAFMQNIRS